MAATERPFSSRGPSVAGGGIKSPRALGRRAKPSFARYRHSTFEPLRRVCRTQPPEALNTLGTVFRMIFTSDHKLQWSS